MISDVELFLNAAQNNLLLDVRSPGEYAIGHIPGAVSFPLFSDQERAEVGTIYKQQGQEQAVEHGLKIVGPKLAEFVTSARQLANGKDIYLYCWRGGMRSNSMAWLLRTAGFSTHLLEGGYKKYRNVVSDGFNH
ncbi:MAG: hypothetical protein RL226_1750, partial [Bacteroidota bacterium]